MMFFVCIAWPSNMAMSFCQERPNTNGTKSPPKRLPVNTVKCLLELQKFKTGHSFTL